jgi:voltage-gated potassium channel
VVTYVAGSAVLLVFVGSLAVLDVEQNAPDAKILSFGDAAWWAITTITTVGYGDLFPVTPIGRLVAAALMMSGIAVLGVVTASIASWLVQRVEESTEAAVESAEIPVRGRPQLAGRGGCAAAGIGGTAPRTRTIGRFPSQPR